MRFLATIRMLAVALGVALSVLPAAGAAEVKVVTSLGEMRLFIDEKHAPATAANFLEYVEAGFFDGLLFHRVIPGFVIQGGGFEPGMNRRETRPPIALEAGTGLKNLKYTLSMARTQDPNSATSQFFINLNDNVSLDANAGSPGYAVFGKVTQGREVVDAIAAVATGNAGPFRDVPVEDVVILEATVVYP